MKNKILLLSIIIFISQSNPVFAAYRKSKGWNASKPSAGSTIDFGDPINRGLVALYLLNEGGGLKTFD